MPHAEISRLVSLAIRAAGQTRLLVTIPFLVMGLIGIVLAGLVNLFIGSSALQFALSVIGVVVFTGLTAWDTQRLKAMYLENSGTGNLAILGALMLYLDFINLFVSLLQLVGVGRD